MGSYINVPGAWKYSDTPTKTRERDTAIATTAGSGGTIESTADASGPDKDSSAIAGWTATLEGKYEWQPASPGEPAPERTTKITVTGSTDYDLNVVAVVGSATASVSAGVSTSASGKQVDTTSLYDRTKTAPTSSHARVHNDPQELLSSEVKHTGTLSYSVTISVNARASRSDEGTSAHAQAKLISVGVAIA